MKNNLGEKSFKYGFSMFVFLFISCYVFADGTKQLRKTVLDSNCIQLYDRSDDKGPYRRFATYEADSNQRLCFTIKRFETEVVLFGFSFDKYSDTVYFRIKDRNGNIVFDPARSINSGAGYIDSYAKAAKGPNHVSYMPNAGGYDPYVFQPKSAGDFYIEFNIGDPEIPVADAKKLKHFFDLFDLTIVNTQTKSPINGRVWSKAWDFNTQGVRHVFTASLYIYSDDGVITLLDFNGMKPFGFVVSCNETGTRNKGTFYQNRQSVLGDSTYPQYKIFLTYPDPEVFPPGELSQLGRVSPYLKCSDEDGYCIKVSTSSSGSISIVIDLNGIPDYQVGSTDVALSYFATSGGMHCIKWNGLDGKSGVINPNVKLQTIITYQKGLTNLPIYDVEGQSSGYIVKMLAPEKKLLELHWDNSAVGGSVSLAGCYPDTLNHKGCIGWSTVYNEPVNTYTVEKPDFGNDKTFNAWWYAALQVDTLYLTLPVHIIAKIGSDHPYKYQNSDTSRFCPNTSIALFDLFAAQNKSFKYAWEEGSTILSSQQSIVFTNETKDRNILLIVSDDSSACRSEDAYMLDVRDIYIPNLITPNGDAMNDQFEIRDLPDLTYIEIFNRWGDLVYKSENYANDWSGEKQNAVYFFQTRPTENCGEYKGWLHVVE